MRVCARYLGSVEFVEALGAARGSLVCGVGLRGAGAQSKAKLTANTGRRSDGVPSKVRSTAMI
jgi:hypothetical protein